MTTKELKGKLKRKGWTIRGKKEDLINMMAMAIESNVPVTATAIEQYASLIGLDVTAKWELLTAGHLLVPEPRNEDARMSLPTECNAPTNPKFSFKETFDCMKFTGTLDKWATSESLNLLGGNKRGSYCQQGKVKPWKI